MRLTVLLGVVAICLGCGHRSDGKSLWDQLEDSTSFNKSDNPSPSESPSKTGSGNDVGVGDRACDQNADCALYSPYCHGKQKAAHVKDLEQTRQQASRWKQVSDCPPSPKWTIERVPQQAICENRVCETKDWRTSPLPSNVNGFELTIDRTGRELELSFETEVEFCSTEPKIVASIAKKNDENECQIHLKLATHPEDECRTMRKLILEFRKTGQSVSPECKYLHPVSGRVVPVQ